MFGLIALYVISVVGLIYILLLGTSEYHRDGIVGKANWFLIVGMWHYLNVFLRRFMPSFVGRCVDGMGDYCCNKPNPFLQIFYFCLVGGGYILFLIYGMDKVPGPFISGIHRITFHLAVWAVLGWFIHVGRCDPGEVNTKNIDNHSTKYHFDKVLYISKTCSTCNVPRPARSKHCRICNRCVSRFDHHCAWINSDVGALNLWKFLLFLLSTGLVCTYCAILSGKVLMGIATQAGLFDMKVKGPNGVLESLTTTYIMQYLIYFNGVLFGLFAFTSIISIVLYAFFLYHCYLVAKNTTTSETFKWGDVKYAITKQREQNPENPPPKSILTNTYDHGIRNNFYEVFFYSKWTGTNKKENKSN